MSKSLPVWGYRVVFKENYMNYLILLVTFLSTHHAFAVDSSRCGDVNQLKGKVFILKENVSHWDPVTAEVKICEGDTLETKAASKLLLSLPGGNQLRLNSNTKIKIKKSLFEKTRKQSLIHLFFGQIRNEVNTKYDAKKDFYRVETKSVIAGVRGTDFLVQYDEQSQSSEVTSFEGLVEATPIGINGELGGAKLVRPGFQFQTDRNRKLPRLKEMPKSEFEGLKNTTNLRAGGGEDGSKLLPRENLRESFEEKQRIDLQTIGSEQGEKALNERIENRELPGGDKGILPPKHPRRPPPKKED